MEVDEIENNAGLQRVLWACYEYWRNESLPITERSVCYTWVVKVYEEKSRVKFHHSALRQLVTLGFLEPDEASRSGSRRYYRIVNPKRVRSLLQKFGLDQ